MPLGEQYLELVTAVDEAEAAGAGFGQSVLERAAAGGGWLTFALATDELDAIAARLGLEVQAGSRTRPDGRVVRWHSAAVDDQRRAPWLPFFLAWDVPAGLHPGREWAGHGVRALGIAGVEIAGDANRLREWLGGEELPIRVIDGEPGIRRVAVATSEAELLVEQAARSRGCETVAYALRGFGFEGLRLCGDRHRDEPGGQARRTRRRRTRS